MTTVTPAPFADVTIRIPLDRLFPSPLNPRKRFDEAKLRELADSIAQIGLLEPLVVRPREDGYEIVAGDRRHRAARLAGLSEVACIVSEFHDAEAQQAMAIENLQRVDLTPMEEARTFDAWLKSGAAGKDNPNPVAALGKAIGKSDDYVRERLRLLKLDRKVQEAVDAGTMRLKVAVLLTRIRDKKLRAEIQGEALEGDVTPHEVRYRLKTELIDLNRAPFPLDASPGGDQPGCDGCPRRLMRSAGDMLPALEGKESDLGVCGDPECFEDKSAAQAQALGARLVKIQDAEKSRGWHRLYEDRWKESCDGCKDKIAAISLTDAEPIVRFCTNLAAHYGTGAAAPPQSKDERKKRKQERDKQKAREASHTRALSAVSDWLVNRASASERIDFFARVFVKASNWDEARAAAHLLGAEIKGRDGLEAELKAAADDKRKFEIVTKLAAINAFGSSARAYGTDQIAAFCKEHKIKVKESK